MRRGSRDPCYILTIRPRSFSLTREDPSAFSPPPAFGPFRVLHQIGTGALGPVFRTYEPTRDRLVAVKVFRLDIIPEQAQALADALNRATQSSLFHPSIVEPIAAGVEGTLAYRAEEYVAAESLDVAMRHYAPAPLEKALPFITQLAGAIDFARAASVGHGGLHPRDIFMTPDEARATGFGVVEALEEVGIRAPTRRPYAAPERIEGAAWSTPADVFSLAAITFELLTGRRPSGTGAQIGTLPDGPHTATVHAVLARAMDEAPAKRYNTALAFAAALEAAGRGQTAPEAPPPPAVVAPAVVAPPVVAPPVVAPTPGELEVEKELDPVLSAIDDVAANRALEAPATRGLFDDVPEETEETVADEEPVLAIHGEHAAPERFAEDFVDEQAAVAETRRPLEAVHETLAPEPETHVHDFAEHSRPAVLPSAVMLVIGLLIGFGGGYFVGSRDRAVPSQEAQTTSAPAAPAAATATPAPATEQPKQFSEEKVTAAPPSARGAARPSATPPPVPDETANAARRPATAGAPAGAARSRSETAPTRGRIVVTSTPARAAVTVNGTWRGRTPLTLDNLAFGRYAVRIVQPGYTTAREDVTLSARDASHEINARLDRAAAPARETAPRPTTRPAAPSASGAPEVFTGSLFVDSRPRGATVFVDGKSVGQTPLSIPDVSIGSHVVRLELAGKKTWTSSTRVSAGQTARVTGSLEDR